MDFIIAGFIEAIRLLFGGDAQTWSAVAATLKASTGSMIASLALGIPLGFVLGYMDFPGKRQTRLLVDTAMALPTVFIGYPVSACAALFTTPSAKTVQDPPTERVAASV